MWIAAKVLVLSCVVGLSALTPSQSAWSNRINAAKTFDCIRTGMSYEQVRRELGAPTVELDDSWVIGRHGERTCWWWDGDVGYQIEIWFGADDRVFLAKISP